MLRRWMVLSFALVLANSASGVVRAAGADLPPAVEAIRQKLLGAFTRAKRIHRAYRMERKGEPDSEIEIFREGERQGWRVRGGASDGASVATDGFVIRGLVDAGPAEVWPGPKAMDASWGPFRRGVEWLAALWNAPVKDTERPYVGFTRVSIEEREGHPRIRAAMVAGFGFAEPVTWLQRDSFAGAQVTEAGALVLVKRGTTELTLRLEDGTVATWNGTVGTAEHPFSLTETATHWTPGEWIAFVDTTCAPPPTQAETDRLATSSGCMHTARALWILRTANPDLFAHEERLAVASRMVMTCFLFSPSGFKDWCEDYVKRLKEWIRDSAGAAPKPDAANPGAKPATVEDLTKQARDGFVEGAMAEVQRILEDSMLPVIDVAIEAHETIAVIAALHRASRRVLEEYAEEKLPMP